MALGRGYMAHRWMLRAMEGIVQHHLRYGVFMAKKKRDMAKAFDLVTCKNGHPRYILGRSIREGVRVEGADFVPIGESARVTVSVQLFDMKCPECGAKVFEPTDDGNYGLKFYNRGTLMGEGKYIDDNSALGASNLVCDELRQDDDTQKLG